VLAACDRAIQLDPTVALTCLNKSIALINLKRYEEAMAACDRAIQLDPNYAFAYNNKA
jgi:tetratricopeptide (TPR) repeat protein